MAFSRHVRRLTGTEVNIDQYVLALSEAYASYEPWVFIFRDNFNASKWLLSCIVWQAITLRGATAYVCDATCDGDVIGCCAVGLLIRLGGNVPQAYTFGEKIRAGLLRAPFRAQSDSDKK